MDKRIALFPFRDDMTCFIHVLLNALDMNEKGFEVRIVMEGAAVKLVAGLAEEGNPLHKLFEKTKKLGLFDGVCRACAKNLGALEAAEKEGLPLLDDMHGHPSMSGYIGRGFTVITF